MAKRHIGLFALCLASTVVPGGSELAGQQANAPRVIHVVAERFAFTPSEIRAVVGEVLELRITSDDTDHGFKLTGENGVDVEIPKRGRGEVRVRFEATAPGRFPFECSRLCGAGHGFMRGSIRVEERKQ